jgi:hypothetical protein
VSAPIRFLGLAILGYVGLRTASSTLALQPLGPPSAEAARSPDHSALAASTLPPGVPADMGPPTAGPYAQVPAGAYGAMPAGAYAGAYGGYGPPFYQYAAAAAPYPAMVATMPMPRASRPYYYPVPYPMPAASYPVRASGPVADPTVLTSSLGSAAAEGYAQPVPALDQWPAIGTAGPFSLAGTQVTPGWEKRGARERSALDMATPRRWSVDGWAMLRPPREGVYHLDGSGDVLNPGFAAGGSLGGSQAGMRITWRPLSSIGVHLRASTALMPQGRSARSQALSGGEGSLGISWQPLKALPVRLLAERRQRLGSALGGGRDAFALLAEGGLYERPLPFGFTLDGYGQAGVIGANRRDLFADGALTATYPFMPRFAIGAGMWGGVQPGLSRFDAGPRLSYQLRPGLRAHLDYRFRMTGNADPRSGPALTIAAGF